MTGHPSFPPRIGDFLQVNTGAGTQVFFSSDRYLLLSLKRSTVSAAGEAGIACDLYDAGEPGQARDAFSAAREIGFFGARKIVVLDYAEALLPKERGADGREAAPEKGSKDKKKASLATLLEEAITKPDPENLLVILFNEIDRRTKLFGLMNSKGIFHELEMPKPATLRAFVRELFGTVHPDEALIDYFLKEEQRDLFFIEHEVTKLKLWAESQGLSTLSLAQAEPLLSSLADETLFRLIDYLIAGKKEKAVSLFRDLRVSEGDPKLFPILIMLFLRHFRVILEGKTMMKMKRIDQIAPMLFANRTFYLRPEKDRREPPHFFMKIAERYKNRTIVEALREAARLELGMKGVYGVAIPDVSVAIEQFMVKYF